jgi:hypothetical protein
MISAAYKKREQGMTSQKKPYICSTALYKELQK